MLPLRISLLSPNKKQGLKKLIHYLFTKELLEVLILTCSVLAVTQLVGWLILTQTVSDLARSSLLVNRESPPYVQEIRRINKEIKGVFNSGVDFDPLTPYLLTIIDTVPADIKLSAVSFDRDAQTLTIDGVARTRDALLQYENVLSSIPWISNVSTPVSQLFQKDNVGFEFQMSLKKLPRLRPLPKSQPGQRAVTD